GTLQAALTQASTAGANFDPSWSPDGKRVAFETNRTFAASTDIWVMNSDGTGARALTANTTADRNPAWSPRGNKVAFQSNRTGAYEIYVMNADDTSHVARITRLGQN